MSKRKFDIIDNDQDDRSDHEIKHIDFLGIKYIKNKKEQNVCDDDDPTVIKIDGSKEWHNKNGERHRDGDKPAVISLNGSKKWLINGCYHRINDEPAVIGSNGFKSWWKHGYCHRDNDEPAIIDEFGNKYWCKKGLIHRDNDKPAKIFIDGEEEYFINGVQYKPKHLIVFKENISEEIKTLLTCSICREILSNPSINSRGYTYCKDCIELWYSKNKTDPMTNLPVSNASIIPNFSIKSLLADNIVDLSNGGLPKPTTARVAKATVATKSQPRSAPGPLID